MSSSYTKDKDKPKPTESKKDDKKDKTDEGDKKHKDKDSEKSGKDKDRSKDKDKDKIKAKDKGKDKKDDKKETQEQPKPVAKFTAAPAKSPSLAIPSSSTASTSSPISTSEAATPRKTGIKPTAAAPEASTSQAATPAKSPPTEAAPSSSKIKKHRDKSVNKKKKKKTAEPTKWEDVREDEEAGTWIEEVDDDEPGEAAMVDDEADDEGDDLRQYLQDMEDPLGIGGEDGRKRKGDHDDDDSDEDDESGPISPKKARRIAAKKSKGTLDPTDEKFDAVMYLVKIHQNTSIEELVTGKGRLELKVTSRQRQLEFLVKDNFSRFMVCKDAVDDIHMTISGQKLNNSTKMVDQASNSFGDLLQRSKDVFVPLLERQQEIDRIKSVLGILKRSQPIFNLPRRMRDNIAAGEYSKVVLNYKKVKSLVATASHASIKNVVSEVESIVKDLRQTLFETLEQPNATLKQQEDTIKLLVDLGSPVDPAWYCLELRHARMKQMLSEKAAKANPVPESPHYSLGLAKHTATTSVILQVSSMLQEYMPPFLHLANNFFDRSYHKSLSEKKKNALSEKHTQADFIAKLYEIFATYTDIVIKSFYGSSITTAKAAAALEFRPGHIDQPFTIAKGPSVSMSSSLIITGKKKKTKARTTQRSASIDAVNIQDAAKSKGNSKSADQSPEVLPANPRNSNNTVNVDEPEQDKEKVLSILKLLQLLSPMATEEYLQPLVELQDLVTRTFVRELFADLTAEAKTWYLQEDWIVLSQQKMITSLPTMFEASIVSALDRLQGLILKDDPLIVYVQKRFIECVECFADNIHHLAFVNPNVQVQATEDDGKEMDDFNSSHYDLPTMSSDARLLVILNNCTYTKKTVLPNIQAHFTEQYGRPMYGSNDVRGGIQLLEQLEGMIVRKYVRHKTVALNEIIRSGLLFSGFDWAGIQAAPYGIRDYAMTLMLELVFIHDELFRVSRSLVRPILSTILENVFQCYIDCLGLIDAITNHGVLQIGMEVDLISSILRKYRSDIGTGLLNEIDHILQYNSIMDPKSNDVQAKDKKIVKSIIANKLQDAALLVECFSGQEVDDLYSNTKR